MTVTLPAGERCGSVKVPASKSVAHRALIMAALGKRPVRIFCDGISKDIEATINCLNAIGADIKTEDGVIAVNPITVLPNGVCRLKCGESGSTLRFMLPIVGALGIEAEFYPKGRLIERPLAPLDKALFEHGVKVTKGSETINCSGKMTPGLFKLAGNVSSQYISGLLMALPLLDGGSKLKVTGEVQSKSYIEMTEEVIGKSGIDIGKSGFTYDIKGSQTVDMPAEYEVEGDYSSASFFLCMGALSDEGISVKGLKADSRQGDRAILDILRRFGAEVCENADGITVRKKTLKGIVIDASQIPDIIPPLCVVAAAAEGETDVINAERLRIKESDRIATTVAMLKALGASAEDTDNGITVSGKAILSGGTADSFNDHRIAMSAAVAAAICKNPVTVKGSECVCKSYPRFFEDFAKLQLRSENGDDDK